MNGQKFSKDKLPWWTVLFKQMPNAIEEIVRCSAAGNKKYPGDSDWKNFERVEDGQNQYKNAAIRHIKESETHIFNKDMAEYDPKVRHLAQAAWNLLILLELQVREEKVGINKARLENTKCVESKEAIQNSINQGDVLPSSWLNKVEELRANETKRLEKKFIDSLYADKGGNGLIDKMVKDTPQQESLPEWMIKQAEEFRKSIDEEAEKVDRIGWIIANGENTPYEDWIIPPSLGCSGVKGMNLPYFDRPTLSVDQLLRSDVSRPLGREDEYPDFPEETNL